ncbi:hypothetical protein TorRG33x02_089820, partial [Trema orientale]
EPYLTNRKRHGSRPIQGRRIDRIEADALRIQEHGQGPRLALPVGGEGGLRAPPSNQIGPQTQLTLAVADQEHLQHHPIVVHGVGGEAPREELGRGKRRRGGQHIVRVPHLDGGPEARRAQ